MAPDEISFGAWLRKQRLRLDLSRQALAGQAGCAEVTLRRIEAGNLKPSRQLALILLEKLGVPQVEREQWVRFARGQAGLPSQAQGTPVNQPKTNLTALLTSFIGREKEMADILRLLEGQRLVTLTGSGGVGKTRLAMQVAGQLLADYAQGVWLVELAPLKDPGLVPQTIASVLGIPPSSASASFRNPDQFFTP